MAINVMKMALDPAAMAKAAAEIAAQLVQNVPDEMKAAANWVNFELVPNPKAHSGFDKVPINPKNGNKAQSNNPDTWGTFGQACDRLKAQPGAVHGVGLMLGHSRFAGFDDDEIYAKLLDDQIKEDVNAGRLPKNTDLKEIHKKVKADGVYNGLTIAEMSAKALESGNFYGADLVKEFNSYTEVSPSGNGLHVYFVGKLPPSGRKKEYFEMYEDGRFLTVTGEPYKGFKAMNAPTAEVIAKYHEKYITKGIYDKKKTSTAPPPPKPTMSSRPAVLDDNQIITRAMRNPKFAALWAGNISGYPSQSEADLALCELLAFWTGGDAEQMDRLFRQSGLYRENKWDRSQSGTTYGAITINKAIDLCPQYYDPNYYSNSSGFNVNIKSPGSTPISIDGTTAPADFVAYNWDGTAEAPAGAAADQPQPITLEQIKAYTPEQWSDIIHQHYGVTAETSRVVEKFARLYERCYRGRLLQDNGRLPKYVKPIIKDRRAKELVYTSIVGFEVNPVPLARFLRERYHIINVPATSNAAGLIYIYSNGKYKRVDAEEEKGLIRVLLESIDQSGGIWDVRKIKDTSLLLHSAENVYSLDAFNTNEKIINFKNGLLDLETGTVYPHSVDTLTTVQLPFNYDPNAGTDTPLFDSMIDHFAEGDEEVKTLLLQFCAATISNIDMGVFKCFLIMYGAGDSGKSQLFKLLHKLVGTDNAHTTTLFKLENNNFEPMNLYGKRFTGHAELDNNSTVRHVGMIKALTGGDYIPGEVKCGGVYNFIYHGTVMFCSNDKPHLPSADPAFYNRLRLVYVSKAVEEKDPKFFEKMWEERHKIINKLMPYLREIIETGEILDPVSSKALKKKYKAENSPAIEFFADCCVMRPAEEFDPTYRKKINDGQTATNVYKDFVNWCLDNGYSSHVIPKKLDFEKDIARYLESEGVISSGTADDIKIKKHGSWYYKFYIKRNVQSDTMPEQSDPTTPTTPSEWDGTPLF